MLKRILFFLERSMIIDFQKFSRNPTKYQACWAVGAWKSPEVWFDTHKDKLPLEPTLERKRKGASNPSVFYSTLFSYLAQNEVDILYVNYHTCALELNPYFFQIYEDEAVQKKMRQTFEEIKKLQAIGVRVVIFIKNFDTIISRSHEVASLLQKICAQMKTLHIETVLHSTENTIENIALAQTLYKELVLTTTGNFFKTSVVSPEAPAPWFPGIHTPNIQSSRDFLTTVATTEATQQRLSQVLAPILQKDNAITDNTRASVGHKISLDKINAIPIVPEGNVYDLSRYKSQRKR